MCENALCWASTDSVLLSISTDKTSKDGGLWYQIQFSIVGLRIELKVTKLDRTSWARVAPDVLGLGPGAVFGYWVLPRMHIVDARLLCTILVFILNIPAYVSEQPANVQERSLRSPAQLIWIYKWSFPILVNSGKLSLHTKRYLTAESLSCRWKPHLKIS